MRNHLEKPSNSIIGCSLGVSSFLWNAWEKPLNRFPCSTVQTRKPLKLKIWQILSCQSVIRPWFSSSPTCDQPWAQVSHSTRAQTCVPSRETLLRAIRHQLSHCCPVCPVLSPLVDLPPMVQSWLSSYHSHLINYYLPSDTFIQKHMFLHSFWLYYWRGLIVQWWQLFTMNECWCRKNWARQSRLKNGVWGGRREPNSLVVRKAKLFCLARARLILSNLDRWYPHHPRNSAVLTLSGGHSIRRCSLRCPTIGSEQWRS